MNFRPRFQFAAHRNLHKQNCTQGSDQKFQNRRESAKLMALALQKNKTNKRCNLILKSNARKGKKKQGDEPHFRKKKKESNEICPDTREDSGLDADLMTDNRDCGELRKNSAEVIVMS